MLEFLPSLRTRVLFSAILPVVSTILVASWAAQPAFGQAASVGIYSDASGNSCSFTDDTPGLVTAYVVVRPDARGMTGVQFAAPLPACFGAVYMYDVGASGVLVIGNSQTGVAVALPSCVDDPVNVLQVVYQRTGGTTPCCAYPIVPDPAVGSILASDCTYAEIPAAGVVSHFNANASCECAGNSAPHAPSNPFPQDGTAGISVSPVMSWFAWDVDDNLADFDVYVGTTSTPPLVASHVTDMQYIPSTPLAPSTQHYWRVVARDALGLESPGPLWHFETRVSNSPPAPPQSPHPIDGEVGTPLTPTLVWASADIDGDALVYDVYLGTSPTPPLVAHNAPQASYAPGTLSYDTHYYWRIVAKDGTSEASGPTWGFTTRPSNLPPHPPSNPVPANDAVNVSLNPTLRWTCTDPDGDALRFDVYFGTGSSTNPPLVAQNVTAFQYTPGQLSPATSYYWKIVARDPAGAETASALVWRFSTRTGNQPPGPPSNPSPADGGNATSMPTLTWQASDPDGDPLTYSVYFGTTPSPPLVATGLQARSYAPGLLTHDTPYYWRVESFDGTATTSGATWSFTTVDGGDVNGDGQLTIDDARCAMLIALGGFCGGSGAELRADVDCSGYVSPRDARCIHKSVVDGSCTFCGGTAIALATNSDPPNVWAYQTWDVADTLITQVFVSGVPTLASFSFRVSTDANVVFIRAVRLGATLGWQRLASNPGPFPLPIPTPWTQFVGGYTLGSVSATSTVALVELHFVLPFGSTGYARLDTFQDDLRGAHEILIPVSHDGGPTPVLISRFEAVRSGSDVEVRWDYASDEPIAGYTLYRRDAGAALPVAITEGVDPSARSYVDHDVQASTTYRYELVVRTRTGGEFHSPTATVTTAALTLSLGQNHPNPFNPQTAIPFDVPGNSTRVRLFVLDAAGRVVRTLVDQNMPGGSHETVWDGRDARGGTVSSGVYFYVLDVGGERRTRKMVLLK